MAEIIMPERHRRSGGPGLSYWLGTKFGSEPLLMHPNAAMRLQAAIGNKAFDSEVSVDVGLPGASKFAGARVASGGYRVTEDGIAIVPIQGVLMDRGDWLGDLGGWATSYEGLAEQFRKLKKDDAVKAVILDIDSGGGMVSGLFDLVGDELAALKKAKKVYAIAANMAASAAYAIGCAADEFYVTRDGIAGSIGVIVTHTSWEGMLSQAGIEPTIIHAGRHKADGNPYQSLTHGARHEMTARCDQIYDEFVRHVAKHRSIEEAAVRETEARTYSGPQAVSAKLADGVKGFTDLLDHVRNGSTSSARGSSKPKGGRMSGTTDPAAARPDYDQIIAAAMATLAANRSDAPTQAAATPAAQTPVASAVAETPAPAPAAAVNDGDRIFAILECDEAKKRPQLAKELAKRPSLSLDDAKAILAAAPEEGAASAPALETAFERRMGEGAGSAHLKPDASTDADEKTKADRLVNLVAKQHSKKQ